MLVNKDYIQKKMKLGEKIYNLVLYQEKTKRLVSSLLRSPLVIESFPYRFFYSRLVKKKMKQFEKIPFRVMVENTNVCNANCVFCPHRIMKRKKGAMPMDLFKKIVDQCRKEGIDYLTIYGFGEPLLDPRFEEKVTLAKELGIARVTTNTNAMYLTRERSRKIIAAGIDEIYISFDAATKKTYRQIRPGLDFKTVEKNINDLVEEKKRQGGQKPEIILSFVETETNKKETEKYLSKWKNKVDHVSISQLHNWTGAVDCGGLENGRRDPCRLLWTDMVISWDGRVPLCCNDYENKIILGNIKRQTIREIWGGKKMKGVRRLHQKGKFSELSLCKKCQYNYHHKSPWWVAK